MNTAQNRRTRLAAIDMDGTLLGPEKDISAANRAALARLHQAGFHVVLATGRHHLNVLPFATTLPEVEWIVSAQGAEVSDVLRRQTLHRTYLDPREAARLASLGPRLGYSAIVYAHDGIFALTADRWSRFYAELSGSWPRDIDVQTLAERSIFKVLWLSDEPQVARVAHLRELTDFGVYQVRTHEHIVEFLSPETSKAAGVRALAAQLAVAPADVVAFGDGENDIPLFEWAGLSVAMPHGWPRARDAAHMTAPSVPASIAFAAGVDVVLARLGFTASAA